MISGYSHSFDTGVANHLGVNAAIVLNHIMYWLRINKKKGENQNEGRTWTFETNKEIADYFGYLTEKQVRNAIDVLVENGLLIKGHFHKNHFNRTNWYAVHDESLIEDKPHLPCRANAKDTDGNSDLSSRANVYINNNNKEYNEENERKKRSDVPSFIQEIEGITEEDKKILSRYPEDHVKAAIEYSKVVPPIESKIKQLMYFSRLDNPVKIPKNPSNHLYEYLVEWSKNNSSSTCTLRIDKKGVVFDHSGQGLDKPMVRFSEEGASEKIGRLLKQYKFKPKK